MAVSIEIGDWHPAPAQALRPAFAVGDVHGRDDLFGPLIETIDRIVVDNGLQAALLVTLGDYIDRGPAGIKALNRAFDGSSVLELEVLPGNHEQFLRNFLELQGYARDNVREIWLENGGDAVARELDFDPDQLHMNSDAFVGAITRAVGSERLDRFLAMKNHVRMGQYLFVHAGIHPDLGLAMLRRNWAKLPSSRAEEDQDSLWIRGPFLTYEGAHEDGVVVIHGHTPRRQVELLPNRINLDTRAYDTGRLSAIQLHGSQLRIIQAVGEAMHSTPVVGPRA